LPNTLARSSSTRLSPIHSESHDFTVNADEVMRLLHEACKRGIAAVVVTHDAQLAAGPTGWCS